MSSGTFERLMRTIRKMEPGTMGGQSRVATPVADIVQVSTGGVAPTPPTPTPIPPSTELTATLISEAMGSGLGWQTKWNPATIDGDGLSDNQAVGRFWIVEEDGELAVDLTATWLDGAAGKQGIGTRTLTLVHTTNLNVFIDQLQHSQSAPPGQDAVGIVTGSLSVSATDRLYVSMFHNAGGNISSSAGVISLVLQP